MDPITKFIQIDMTLNCIFHLGLPEICLYKSIGNSLNVAPQHFVFFDNT